LALGQLRLNFSVGAKTIVRVDNQTLTFANGGNQAVSINRLGYLLNGVNEKPDGNLCSDDEPSAKAPAELPRLNYLALAKEFVPFTVKPGEINVVTYDFIGDPIRPTPTRRASPHEVVLGGMCVR
jgi:hypothetical protein